jgi:hypothetical protein
VAARPSTWRETQIPTSGLRSAVPPNEPATSPAGVSTIVDAWHEGNGAVSKMNSDTRIGDAAHAPWPNS